MKIEMGESLAYSFLRHVKQCWLVQANWKASEHWSRILLDEQLESLFAGMRERFETDGTVFRRTRSVDQFLKQAEIDVLGVGQNGSVHALDVAFHEAGLNYGGAEGTRTRVLKKVLRSMLILRAYLPADTPTHLYFVSPKVRESIDVELVESFAELRTVYPDVGWHLQTNARFRDELVRPTLVAAQAVADTSELFVRSAKLLEVSGLSSAIPDESSPKKRAKPETSRIPRATLQPLVSSLMKTMLEDYPELLDEEAIANLTDSGYCRRNLGLQIGNLALLRRRKDGRSVRGYSRYWSEIYGGQYFVVSQWGKQYHTHNAQRLLRWIDRVIGVTAGSPGRLALQRHRTTLERYVEQALAH
ncbi:MAG: hypothetical protein OXG17_05520 [Chloroflexi bacterium]|nr:hypothetical protein [Chloroflexota bacterium]